MKKTGYHGNKNAQGKGPVQTGKRESAPKHQRKQHAVTYTPDQWSVIEQAMKLVEEQHSEFARVAAYQRARQILTQQ